MSEKRREYRLESVCHSNQGNPYILTLFNTNDDIKEGHFSHVCFVVCVL